MAPSSQPVDQVDSDVPAIGHRTSKTKAMRDAPWRSLMPKSFSKTQKSTSAGRTQTHPNKKRKVSSGQVAQPTAPNHEDITEDIHHHRAQFRGHSSHDVPPHFARRKRVQVLSDDHSDTSDSSTLDSQAEDNNHNEDLQNLNSDELALMFDDEAIQWDQHPLQPSQPVRRSQSHNGDAEDDSEVSPEEDELDDNRSQSDDNPQLHKAILIQRAAARQAEALEFSDDSEIEVLEPTRRRVDNGIENLDSIRPRFAGPQNEGWQHAPFLPTGPGQRNILINAQPAGLKIILKHAIKCLIRDCAFKHGYIPVDKQTDCLVHILVSSAVKLDIRYFTERVQKDPLLQKAGCDLLIARISHYRTTVKGVALGHVTHGYNLSDDSSSRKKQVESLLLHDKFIFQPKEGDDINSAKPFHHPVIINTIHEVFFKRKRGPSIAQKYQGLFSSSIDTGVRASELELPPAMVAMAAVAVQASLEEKVTGLDFNADAYEDSYDVFIRFLDHIRMDNLPAYHRLMADLYKFISSKDHHIPRTRENAMWLLDMDSMDV